MAIQQKDQPRTFIDSNAGGEYPRGPFLPTAPPGVLLAAAFMRNLEAWNLSEVGGHFTTLAPFAERLGVSTSVFHRFVRGIGYPDLSTIARIEARLGVILWPSFEHRLALQEGIDTEPDKYVSVVNPVHLQLRDKTTKSIDLDSEEK
jgi:transcriptional regulator with XRE-family HTH domain